MATKKDRDKKKQRADKAKKQYNKNKGNRPTRKSNTAAGNKAEKAAYAKQKVQDAATARRQAGISIKDTIRDNRQAVKDFATNQHQKFKQTGVQLKVVQDHQTHTVQKKRKVLLMLVTVQKVMAQIKQEVTLMYKFREIMQDTETHFQRVHLVFLSLLTHKLSNLDLKMVSL